MSKVFGNISSNANELSDKLKGNMTEKMNISWSWLSMIALNLFEFSKSYYNKDITRLFNSIEIIDMLIGDVVNKKNKIIKDAYLEVNENIEWLEENMPKIYQYDQNGEPRLENPQLKFKVLIKLKKTFKLLIKVLDESGLLKFVAQDPGEVLKFSGD